jgi:hypothetical protein
VLQAGSTITVTFQETIQHPGYFRIAFSPDGLSGFDQHILVPMIADTDGLNYSAQVHLPSTSCDNCSLQLIQCMDGSLPPIASCNNYYSCSDIVLTGGSPGGSADAGPSGRADAGGPGDPSGADSGPSADPGVGPPPELGCGVAGRRSSGMPWSSLVVFGLVVLGRGRPRNS